MQSEIEGARGRTYDELNDELKGRFLNYQLSIDLFVSVLSAEIRQAFRRLNSYTVPRNPEELRHAEYQGVFKWFIYKTTREYEETLLALGVLSEKHIVRMQDATLFAECTHALLHGVKTTKAKDLDNLYAEHEKEFLEESAIRQRFEKAVGFVLEISEIHQGPLMKPFVFYSLLLAVSQMLDPTDVLQDVFLPPQPYEFQRDIVVANLTALAEALETDAPEEKWMPFVLACAEKTNVDRQRKTRIAWLANALLPNLV